MASSSSALIRFQSACVTCVRGGQRAASRYRDFLASPGTLFTLASLLLLIAATIQTPYGLVNSAHARTWLYLAAALAGSVYNWWSAIQGIRARDFTADIKEKTMCTFENERSVLVCDVAIHQVREAVSTVFGDAVQFTPAPGQGTRVEVALTIDKKVFEEVARSAIAAAQQKNGTPNQ